jgi:hypothetical protein
VAGFGQPNAAASKKKVDTFDNGQQLNAFFKPANVDSPRVPLLSAVAAQKQDNNKHVVALQVGGVGLATVAPLPDKQATPKKT